MIPCLRYPFAAARPGIGRARVAWIRVVGTRKNRDVRDERLTIGEHEQTASHAFASRCGKRARYCPSSSFDEQRILYYQQYSDKARRNREGRLEGLQISIIQ